MATFGKIGEFDPNSEDWSSYIERVQQFFIANDLQSKNDKQKTILLSSCGAKTYQLLRGLADNKPSEKSFEEPGLNIAVGHRRMSDDNAVLSD